MLTCALFVNMGGRDACPPPEAPMFLSRAWCHCLNRTRGGRRPCFGPLPAPLTGHEACLGPSRAAVAPTRDDGYMYYAEDVLCVSDLACVRKKEAVGNVAVHPDALMSMQPSFQRCSRLRKKVCPVHHFSLLSACLACESGKRCRGPPGPVPTPCFRFSSGTEWRAIRPSRSRGLTMVRNGRIFLASALAISGATS